MAIFQSDLSIKTAIELGIEDLRKNPWLIDDILGDCLTNPYLRDKYGKKQIDACKEWFASNEIHIYMSQRTDHMDYPCITISLGTSQEKSDMKHMADQSTEGIKLIPQRIGKPIPYIVPPFTIDSYDPNSGEVQTLGADIDLTLIAPGQILVNPANGQGYVIQDTYGEGVIIEEGLTLDTEVFGIIPKFGYYKARVEHTFFQETYNIGCHAHGDQQVLLWLHSIALYSILRYREGLLEHNGFAESSVSSGEMMLNQNMSSEAGEFIWTRVITLTGQVENSWIKSPRRYLETVALKGNLDGGYEGGIQILSNLDNVLDDVQDVNWFTVKDDSEG